MSQAPSGRGGLRPCRCRDAQRLRQALKAFGGLVEGVGHLGFEAGGQFVVGGPAHGRELLLGRGEALLRLGEFVDEGQRRHDVEAHVADLAEGAAQLGDLRLEGRGDAFEMGLLALPARHAVAAPGDRDLIIGIRLSRSFTGRRGIGAPEHVAHGADGAVHPAADVGGRGLHAGEPRAGALELDGKPGAVVLHDLQLGLEVAAAAFEVEPPPERRLERAERRLEPPHRIAERPIPPPRSVRED